MTAFPPPAVAALVERLRAAYPGGHHAHLDREGTAGANCPACKDDMDLSALKTEAAAALEALARERDAAVRSLSPECRDLQASMVSFNSFQAGHRLIYAVDPKWNGSARSDFPELIDKLIADRDALRERCAVVEKINAQLVDEREGVLLRSKVIEDRYAHDCARIAALEKEARQLSLDLQAAEARASGAEARERCLKAARAELEKT